jgi:hypothetical protein
MALTRCGESLVSPSAVHPGHTPTADRHARGASASIGVGVAIMRDVGGAGSRPCAGVCSPVSPVRLRRAETSREMWFRRVDGRSRLVVAGAGPDWYRGYVSPRQSGRWSADRRGWVSSTVAVVVVRWVGAGLVCAGDGRPHLHRCDGGVRRWYRSSDRRPARAGRTRSDWGGLLSRSRGGRACWVSGWMSLPSRCRWWSGLSQRRPAGRGRGGVVAGDPEC